MEFEPTDFSGIVFENNDKSFSNEVFYKVKELKNDLNRYIKDYEIVKRNIVKDYKILKKISDETSVCFQTLIHLIQETQTIIKRIEDRNIKELRYYDVSYYYSCCRDYDTLKLNNEYNSIFLHNIFQFRA
jgi:hypothetical protein